MTTRIAIATAALGLAVLPSPLRADLSIYVQDTTLAPGGYGLLNVYLAGAPTDRFDNDQVTLAISQANPANPAAPDFVNFAPNDPGGPASATIGEQSYRYIFPPGWTSANPTTAPNYIFPDDSLDASGPYNGGYRPYGNDATVFTITDMSLSQDDAPSSGAAPTGTNADTLLGSLVIEATSARLGEQFVVSLVSDGTEGPTDSTYFESSTGDTLTYAQSLAASPGFTGTITIAPTEVHGVPEPVSHLTTLTGAALWAAYGLLRRRRGTVGTR